MIRRVAVLMVIVLASATVSAQWRPGGKMRIVLLVDSSGAVGQMLTPMRAALNAFLDELPEDPEIALISTGGQIRIRVPPTSDRQKLHEGVDFFASDGGANAFIDTLIESDQRFLKNAPDRRPVFVIVTTDGGNTTSSPRVDAYNKFAQDFVGRGGRAHAIVIRGVNSGITSTVIEHLVDSSGGHLETINVASAIPRSMKAIVTYVAADQ